MRKITRQLVSLLLESELLDQPVDPLLRAHAAADRLQSAGTAFEELRREAQVLVHAQLEKQVGDLERACQPRREHHVRRRCGQILVVEHDPSP